MPLSKSDITAWSSNIGATRSNKLAQMKQPIRYEFNGSFAGGLAPGNDISNKNNPAQARDASNIVWTKPVSYLSGVPTKKGVGTTPPPSFIGSSANSYSVAPPNDVVYTNAIHTKTIATFENTDWPGEVWAFGGAGTASLVAAITEGDQCLSLANTAGQTCTGTCTLPSQIDLSSPSYGILAADFIVDSTANFSAGYIRIGSDSTNYRQYDLSVSGMTANVASVIKFTFSSPSSTTGTPDMAAIDYVQVSLTAGGGGAVTGKVDNLRLGSFASAAIGTTTLTASAGNVMSAFVLDNEVSGSGTTKTGIVFVCGDTVFARSPYVNLSDGSNSGLSMVVKSGFKNTSPISSSGTNFYFTQFPKTGSINNNVLYFVDGSDGYFSYDGSASAGSRNSRISSTDFKYICSHKNMIFLAGDPTNPNTVYPSDLGDPTTITAGNAVVLPNVSGSYVTGVYSMDEYLIITRNTDIWILSGSDPDSTTGDFDLRRSRSRFGCVEQKMGCVRGRILYFFSGNAICRFNGDDSEVISEGFEDRLDSFHQKLCSIFYNSLRDCVVFNYVPSSATVDPIVTKTGFYQLWFRPEISVWGIGGELDDASSVVFWGITWGGALYSPAMVFRGGLQFYQLDPTTPTDISTMTWELTTAWNDCGSPDDYKDFSDLGIFFRDIASADTPTVTVTVYTDYDETTAKQTFTNVTPDNNQLWLGLAGCAGHAISFKIAGTCDDQKDEAVMLSRYSGVFTYAEAT